MTQEITRESRYVRHWALLRLITANRYMTLDKLARDLSASKRTIRRDIACLSAAGFPLYLTDREEREQFIRMDRDWFMGFVPKSEFVGARSAPGWNQLPVRA